VLLSLAVSVSVATLGVDVSSPVGPSAWTCLKNNGYVFGIIRCYESGGSVDPNCPHTIYNAWDGGAAHVDIYMFPDPSKGNPEGQVTTLLNYLAGYNIHNRGTPPGSYGMLWFDIEGTQYWQSSQSENQAFFNGLVSAGRSAGISMGVYTSKSQWEPIMGNWAGGSSLPLWYAHYDNNPSFSDFSPFGGWSRPSIKQYLGTSSVCGAGVDKNWYPNGEAPYNMTDLYQYHRSHNRTVHL